MLSRSTLFHFLLLHHAISHIATLAHLVHVHLSLLSTESRGKIFVSTCIRLQRLIQSFHKVGFLLFNMLIESVANELDILFSLSRLSIFLRDERFFFIKVIEVFAIFLTLKFRNPRNFLSSQVVPVSLLEERMVLDFLNSI